MDILNESERRFTKKLCDAMIPVMIETFWDMWLEAKKETRGRHAVQNFQERLRAVKTWNSSISTKNSDAIIKNQPLFPSLLAAVFIIHVKILSAIRTDKKSKKICIKLPATDVFSQRCYEACAKDLYDSPSIIVDNKPEHERVEDLNKRFNKNIIVIIEDLIPTGEILSTYLPSMGDGGDLNMDEEDDEEPEEDDIPDMVDEAPVGNMEFAQTPGGEHTQVTVNNSLTPPSVPGVTPVGPTAAPEPEGESLFRDAPLRIEKITPPV
jgi:hypothetical protein